MDKNRVARELVRLAKVLVSGKINRAYDEMVELVEGGMDFPDAHERVIESYKLSAALARRLVEWYDEEH